MTGLGSTLGSYHSEADHWTSYLTSLRLSLFIKMGTLGAAARIHWDEVANSVVTYLGLHLVPGQGTGLQP